MKTMNRDKAIIVILLIALIAPPAYNWYYDHIIHDWAYNWASGQRVCRKTGILQYDWAMPEPGCGPEYGTIGQVENPDELIEQWRAEGYLVIR